MKSTNDSTFVDFGGPATYRIVIQGKLDAGWSDRLAGMRIASTTGKEGNTQSTLVGPIRDQAELNGVLETLYGLHLPILRVEAIDEDK